jgi:hypothetical protein
MDSVELYRQYAWDEFGLRNWMAEGTGVLQKQNTVARREFLAYLGANSPSRALAACSS